MLALPFALPFVPPTPAIAGPRLGIHATAFARPPAKVGLGVVLTTSDGGQVYGFDVDQNGTDGVLASAETVSPSGANLVSMETFNQNTGKITKTFARYEGLRNSYAVDGIYAGDVGLVTHYVTPKGTIYARREYDVMNPVTAQHFTGTWTPPVNDINIEGAPENQATSTAVFFAIELKKQDAPIVFSSNVAANTFSKVIALDKNLFGYCTLPQTGQYLPGNDAIFALSPDCGEVGGQAPLNVVVDLANGKSTQFNGYNNGYFHAGDVNGIAVDPNTGVGATDTELNAQVEFYNFVTEQPITFAQLPCTGNTSQINSGSGIAVDPVNKLFLVTETYSGCASGSALVVYDESGSFVESIPGFQFAIGEPAPVLNPNTRTGWAFGPSFSQLQQFFY
jgi:hypothetical protein